MVRNRNPKRPISEGLEHSLLPRDAQVTLKTAARIDPYMARGLSFERRKAIGFAIETVKKIYPSFFKKEN